MLFWCFISFLFFLLSIAYVTLMERHLLGLSQLRLGPSKSGMRGVLQPFMDAFKLFRKSAGAPIMASTGYFWVSPVLLFALLFWQIPIFQGRYIPWSMDNSLIYLLSLVGLTIYVQFVTSFFSASKYAYIGAIRGVVQSVSYEIPFFFFIFSVMMTQSSFSSGVSCSLYFVFLGMGFFLLMMAELGRAPFDLLEGESELVSGYNVEYGGVLFIFIFLSEYGMLLSYSAIMSSVFYGWDVMLQTPLIALIVSLFLLCRSAFPRIRYDVLMSLCWFSMLPLGMHCCFFFYLMSILFFFAS